MKTSLYSLILRLVSYGLNTGLIEKEDTIYTINQLLDLYKMDEPDDSNAELTDDSESNLEEILSGLLDYAYERNLIPENTVTYRDLFDVRIMSTMVKRPSEVIKEFWSNYNVSPVKATDYYYKFSRDTDYIRRYRVKKDLKWKTSTEYGDIDITINLSKPEKDPKAIAQAKLQKQSSYPKCLLCKENEGYAGRINHPARSNHRIIPITLDNSQWYMQYSPYVYYNEHCIVFNGEHTPMVIDSSTFRKLFDFIKMFPHYIIGSNADLPIVGGSILTHEHFQGGRYNFALNKADVEEKFSVSGYENVECGIVKWPMSVIRLTGEDTDSLIKLSEHILNKWRNYTDEDSFIFAETDGERHSEVACNFSSTFGSRIVDIDLVEIECTVCSKRYIETAILNYSAHSLTAIAIMNRNLRNIFYRFLFYVNNTGFQFFICPSGHFFRLQCTYLSKELTVTQILQMNGFQISGCGFNVKVIVIELGCSFRDM